MSEYGIRINNYQAASIYEYSYGFRGRLDATKAMLTNSLFKDYLMEIGLHVHKNDSTRDIICVEFGYGTKDYDTTMEKLNKILNDEKTLDSTKINISKLIENVENNADKCIKISKKRLRTLFYTQGFHIDYNTYNRSGEIIDVDRIHYKMLYRTPGKAKKGTCMFIRDELYDKAHEFLYMGIQLPEKNSPIVEVGAYASLITSSIIGKVTIRPEEMLIVKDVNTVFNTNVVTINTNKDKECIAKRIDNYDIENEIFDGQALIDESIFPSWGDGYILLRHHFTKCAAFSTNIQMFMKDYFGEKYDTATVKDMFGNDVPVKNVKLITTNNAIKWLNTNI